jgi:hypothetical protein
MSGDGSSRKQSTGECPQRGGDNPSPHWPALRRRGGRGPGRLRQPARRSLRLLPGRPSAGARRSLCPARPSARLGRLGVHHGRRHLAIWPGIARGCHSASLAQFHRRRNREDQLPMISQRPTHGRKTLALVKAQRIFLRGKLRPVGCERRCNRAGKPMHTVTPIAPLRVTMFWLVHPTTYGRMRCRAERPQWALGLARLRNQNRSTGAIGVQECANLVALSSATG